MSDGRTQKSEDGNGLGVLEKPGLASVRVEDVTNTSANGLDWTHLHADYNNPYAPALSLLVEREIKLFTSFSLQMLHA